MRRKLRGLIVAAALALPTVIWPQLPAPEARTQPNEAVTVTVSAESPVALESSNFEGAEIRTRGALAVIDLHGSLRLRNSGSEPIVGAAFSVTAQEGSPGGEAAVLTPALDVQPGRTWAVPLDLRLVRPVPAPGEPLVQIVLDGLLLESLEFVGPDRRNSRRKMTLLELEARRDRDHLAAVLNRQGREALRSELLAVVARSERRPGFQARLAGARSLADDAGRVELATLNFPSAPLELLGGSSRVEGEYAAAPEFRMLNRSRRTVRHFEIGWIIRSSSGRSYSAAAAPPDQSPLPSGETTHTASRAMLRFPLEPSAHIGSMSAYVRRVEFEDGGFWIPSRESLEESALLESEPLTAEERRLSEIYRRQGLDAVIAALDRD